MVFLIATALVALVIGAVAAITGFGVGSTLTPWLALKLGTKVAIAAMSIPHLVATALRFWALRRHVDRSIFLSFGITSAVGALVGSLLHARVSSPVLTITFAGILLLTGAAGTLGWSDKFRLPGSAAWIGGALSGLLGGMVGSQGPIRAAAMLGLNVPKHAFVATSTAIALIVDFVRTPVYIATTGSEMRAAWPYVAAALVGITVGTLAGYRLLERIPPHLFRRIVSAVILLFGVVMLARELL